MPIVRRTAGQLARDRREIQLTSALAIEKMQDEIAEVLTPEQRVKFEDLISRSRGPGSSSSGRARSSRQPGRSSRPQPPPAN